MAIPFRGGHGGGSRSAPPPRRWPPPPPAGPRRCRRPFPIPSPPLRLAPVTTDDRFFRRTSARGSGRAGRRGASELQRHRLVGPATRGTEPESFLGVAADRGPVQPDRIPPAPGPLPANPRVRRAPRRRRHERPPAARPVGTQRPGVPADWASAATSPNGPSHRTGRQHGGGSRHAVPQPLSGNRPQHGGAGLGGLPVGTRWSIGRLVRHFRERMGSGQPVALGRMGSAQRRFPGYAQERAPEGDPQGDAPCPRYRNVPIRLCWFMASG